MNFRPRNAVAAVVFAGVLLLLGACGGGGPSDPNQASGEPLALKGEARHVAAAVVPNAVVSAPLITYTDTVTGPTRGGENNLGGYLSIFGSNFGSAAELGSTTKVFIGNSEVANYRYLGASKVSEKLAIQQLTVQVGNLGNAPFGTALPVRVVVNGVSSTSNTTFTPTAGRVLFVSLSADVTEATAEPNRIDRPYRWLQNMDTQPWRGAYFAMQAGDQVVIRGGHWMDNKGVNGSWMTFGMNSAARNGRPNAWIHFTAYPGEDVHYTSPPESKGGFQGPWGDIAGTSGEYIAFSNFRMDVAPGMPDDAHRDASGFNLQSSGGHWRVVNNEIGPLYRGQSTFLNTGGVTGHGEDVSVLGNHIHHIEGTAALQAHGIYADTTAENWDVGYNWIHDIPGGSLVQFNDNSGGAGTLRMHYKRNRIWEGFINIKVHHNWLENAAKYGVNFSDENSTQRGSYQGRIWNNVIIGTKMPPLRILSTQPRQNLVFAFNTIYNAMTEFSGTGNGYVRSDGWSKPKAGNAIENKFYNNIFSFGPRTVANTEWFVDAGARPATEATYDFKNNLYDYSSYPFPAPPPPSGIGDSNAVTGNPLFVNPAVADLRLQMVSPARNAAVRTIPNFVVLDDFTRLATRVQGAPTDIGAYVAR